MALEGNPTLAQAAAEIKAVEGKKLQAGFYPNPFIGATGDENTPGLIIRGGEFGFFVEQRFVTAGKLGKSRSVAEQERLQAETTAHTQKHRVLKGGLEAPGAGGRDMSGRGAEETGADR